MSDRLHLIVFGATGFTASIILTELLHSKPTRWPPGFKWSIAGRNHNALEKLRSSLFWQESTTPLHHVPWPSIVLADVHDQETLINMAGQTQLLLNCVGPYRDYGEPVVKACIETGTDYIDLSGEPAFIERMHLLYHDSAVRAGLTICHAVAFDSVPCDLGVNLCKKLLAEKGAYPSSVEMVVTLNTTSKLYVVVNYPTYQAAVKGFSSTTELRESRKELARVRPRPVPIGPPLDVKIGGKRNGILGRARLRHDTRLGGWLVPYFFSDPAVVHLSQSLNLHMTKPSGAPAAALAPIHFAAHIRVPTLTGIVLFMVHFLVFQFLAIRAWGRNLLYSYPSLFTWGMVRKHGIDASQLDGTTFTQTFYAKGYSQTLHPTPANTPDVNLTMRLFGPEPGYKATAVIFLEAASLLLRRRDAITKGVLTPAVAFGHLDRTSPNVSPGEPDGGLLDALQKDGRVIWSVINY